MAFSLNDDLSLSMNPLRKYILDPLESGSNQYEYKPLQRHVLLFLSTVFLGLGIGVAFVAKGQSPIAYLPTLIFGCAGLYGLTVGLIGSDKAVSTLWRSARESK